MCGIVGVRATGDGAGDYLVGALRRLEYRGYDSVGVAIRTESARAATIRTTGRVEELDRLVGQWQGSGLGALGIGHTRWATHGAVSERNAHPHHDCTGRIAVVHNGILANAEAERARLEEAGHRFASDVDSEVVSHLVEEALAAQGPDAAAAGAPALTAAVAAAVSRLEGSWALAVLDVEGDALVATATRSPLLVATSGRGSFVASDIGAIAPWVRDFRVVRDGDLVTLGEEVSWSNAQGPVAPPPLLTSATAADTSELGDYPDHMSREIDEQPAIAERILEAHMTHMVDGSLWHGLGLSPFRRVAILGCGTSLNAGGAIAAAFGGLGAVPSQLVIASEADRVVLEPDTLLIAISQSGETADVLRALDTLDPAPGTLLSLTNNPHSTLARRSDDILDCSAGPEIGVAATKTFIAQVVTGVALVVSALADLGRIDSRQAARYASDLWRVPAFLRQALHVSQETVPALVPHLVDSTGFLFLGRGAGVVYAAEGALKLKELTYRWAEAFPAGELKHGPLALVGQGTPVLVVDNADPRLDGSIAEVRARGGHVLRIGAAGSSIPAVGWSAEEPHTSGLRAWGPLEAVVPLQVLARELAHALGLDVDKPRNLAKSVTVE